MRDVDTLQIVQLYSCLDRIKHIEWCCRSEYILCGLLKRPTVQVGESWPMLELRRTDSRCIVLYTKLSPTLLSPSEANLAALWQEPTTLHARSGRCGA